MLGKELHRTSYELDFLRITARPGGWNVVAFDPPFPVPGWRHLGHPYRDQ